MTLDPHIRPLNREEIRKLAGFAPPEWNFDLPAFLSCHFGEPYFYTIVACSGDRLVGVGNGIMNGAVGWLGNIIVLPEFRGQGIGRGLTQSLVTHLTGQGCRHLLLIATRMGESLYRGLGFQVSSFYRFFRGPKIAAAPDGACLRRAVPADLDRVLQLDREVSGERRDGLIHKLFDGCWIFRGRSQKTIAGFYLPNFGAGLVMARSVEAGLTLLHLKHHQAERPAVTPEANEAAGDLLLRNGFVEYQAAPRMFLGEDVAWKPEFVYSRGSGYCG